ncbi:hypothetical protein RUM44_004839 [Polyplax serrata]|uniref:Uncharacterized protein n=1 Tax=Polyplax serrata TaxID=468196 RepID=A0ABR1B4P8_POLSC
MEGLFSSRKREEKNKLWINTVFSLYFLSFTLTFLPGEAKSRLAWPPQFDVGLVGFLSRFKSNFYGFSGENFTPNWFTNKR